MVITIPTYNILYALKVGRYIIKKIKGTFIYIIFQLIIYAVKINDGV